MTYKLEKLTENNGLEYFGIVIDVTKIEYFLSLIEQFEPSEKIERLKHFRKERDGDSYHLTIINPFELESVEGRALEICEFETNDITFLGLGTTQKEGSIAYYVVSSSNDIRAFREGLGLPPSDLHVTLGFYPADIHGVDKGERTIISRG
ncbi:MAG: 2'-5' RNA ligase family protein [Kangiellaceae bacterium]|nr:2'-5' RNA ligase family protein [Kangiellaceae bacterium]